MKINTTKTFKMLSLIAIFSVPPLWGQADTTVDFEDLVVGAQFDGDLAGNTAGPLTIDMENVTFTTSNVTGNVATSSFGLGINNGGADPDTESFNIGESWSFYVDSFVSLKGLELGGLQSEETFDIQSDDWMNLTGVTPSAGVSYDAPTGTFTLTDGPVDDIFSLDDLTGGISLRVNAGTDIFIGNLTSTFGPNDDVELQSLVFAIPEPGSGLVLSVIGLALLKTRRRTQNR